MVDQDPDGDGEVVSLNLMFPGQYYDSETGLHYNYFRTYDPSTGRYLESDPIGLWGGLNTYIYATNNPLIYTDPTGLITWNESRGIYDEAKRNSKPNPGAGPFGVQCGTGSGTGYIPDAYFLADFSFACAGHDECYETCGKSKEECDLQFLRDLKQACGGVVNFSCIAVARLYYDVVDRSQRAQRAYNDAQQGCCK